MLGRQVERKKMDTKVHVPLYDGKQKNFDKWREKFEAYCYTRNCGECLYKDGDSDLPEAMKGKFSTNASTAKLEKEAVLRNTKAMALLTMTLVTPTCRVIIHSSKMGNNDWPTGLAYDVMERLKKKFKPDDTISAVELNSRLSKLKIKASDHPDLLFDKLAEINIAYGYQLDESRQISEIMAKSPKMYTDTLLTEKRVVEMSKEILTLDHLQNALNQYWRIEHGDDSDSGSDDEDGSEKAEVLAAVVEAGKDDYKKNIECFKCGKMGHYARDCRSGEGNSNNRNKGTGRGYGRNSGGGRGNGKFTGKCHKCGKTGHKKENCWSKTQSEIGAAAVDRSAEGTIEYLMSHVDIEGEIFDMDDPRCYEVEDLFCTDNEEVDC